MQQRILYISSSTALMTKNVEPDREVVWADLGQAESLLLPTPCRFHVLRSQLPVALALVQLLVQVLVLRLRLLCCYTASVCCVLTTSFTGLDN